MRDLINYDNGAYYLTKHVGKETVVSIGSTVNFADMATDGVFYAQDETTGESQTGVYGDTLTLTNTATVLYELATPTEPSYIASSGELLQDTVTTLEQLQNIPTDYDIKFTVNVKDTTVEQITQNETQDGRILQNESDIDALQVVIPSNKIIKVDRADWDTYTRQPDEMYAVVETDGTITWYFGTVGV